MRCSRRAFLEAGLALPAVLHSAPEPGGWRSSGPAFSQDSSFDPWVEIHAENLRHNVTEISRRVSVRPILAVIKRSEEHTSELQSHHDLVCRLLLEKKKKLLLTN